jgi:hypothetical protein
VALWPFDAAAVYLTRLAVRAAREALERRRASRSATQSDTTDRPEDPATWLSLDYVHEQIQAQIEHQSDVWDTVDGRLRLVLGVIGIAFAGALGLRSFSGGNGTTVFLPFLVGLLASLAVGVYLVAAAIVGIAYLPMNFDWPPKPAALRDAYLLKDTRETKLAVLDTLIAAYVANEQAIARKITAFVWAFTLTAVATIMLGIALIGNIAWQTYAP